MERTVEWKVLQYPGRAPSESAHGGRVVNGGYERVAVFSIGAHDISPHKG